MSVKKFINYENVKLYKNDLIFINPTKHQILSTFNILYDKNVNNINKIKIIYTNVNMILTADALFELTHAICTWSLYFSRLNRNDIAGSIIGSKCLGRLYVYPKIILYTDNTMCDMLIHNMKYTIIMYIKSLYKNLNSFYPINSTNLVRTSSINDIGKYPFIINTKNNKFE